MMSRKALHYCEFAIGIALTVLLGSVILYIITEYASAADLSKEGRTQLEYLSEIGIVIGVIASIIIFAITITLAYEYDVWEYRKR